MTLDLHKIYGSLIALVLVVGALAFWRHDIQIKAVAQAQIQQVADSVSKERDAVQVDAQLAQVAAETAQQQQAKALQLVAAGKRLQAHTDSVAREASNARVAAEAALQDSLATVSQLRAALSGLRDASLRDSSAAVDAHARDQQSIAALMGVIAADSAALAAERARNAALTALAGSLSKELALTKAQQPSALKKLATGLLWAGGGYVLGRVK